LTCLTGEAKAMRNDISRKGLVLGILLLFVTAGIVSALNANPFSNSLSTYSGKWLYVGGSGPGNYSTIQDAINNAGPGDTIFVYHGTYYGYFKVSQLTLIGEDRKTTIIDGGGAFSEVLHIEDEVNIQGFTVQNTNHSSIGDVAFFMEGKDITISNNIITECSFGIYDYYAGGEIDIFNNIFLNISDRCITFQEEILKKSVYSIHDNYFYSNHIGIHAGGGRSVSIEHNHFEDNDIGVDAFGSHATINRNNFINNDIQAQFERVLWPMAMFYYPMYYKPSFSENYWEDWVNSTPRPIRGNFLFVMMNWFKVGYAWTFSLPILLQFDEHPAQEPYDIPGAS